MGILSGFYNLLFDAAVINTISDVIALTGLAEIRKKGDINNHILFFLPFFIMHTDGAPDEQIANEDTVHKILQKTSAAG